MPKELEELPKHHPTREIRAYFNLSFITFCHYSLAELALKPPSQTETQKFLLNQKPK